MKTPKVSKATNTPQCLNIGNATIYLGDSVQLLQQLGLQVDALVTDPPYSSGGTQDRLCRTDADRLILGACEALGYFDASGASAEAPSSAVRKDLRAISEASKRLLKAIQTADAGARRAIHAEAIEAIGFADKGFTLSQAGDFAVHWFEALRRRGHLELALAIADGAREFERRAYPILSALWDLSSDVASLADDAAARLPKGNTLQPGQVVAQGLARSIVGHMQANLSKKVPASLWVEELVALAGSYRGVTIGKSLTRKALKDNATWLAARCKGAA